jgi:hypothetical protein
MAQAMRTELTQEERSVAQQAKQKAYDFYQGKITAHRSCGICLAETFNLATPAYQALRKGGILGEGQCGTIKAGEMILGEYLGDPDPTGKITDELREAMTYFTARWKETLNLSHSPDIICDNLVGHYEDFMGQPRVDYCAILASEVAALIAETLLLAGIGIEITPIN